MSVWTEFHERHKRQNFTPAFNAYLEAQIDDAKEDIRVRGNAWLLRSAWGNHSDSPVNADGVLQVQADCARRLGVDRRVVSPVFQELAERNYIRIEGREITLIDDPRGAFAKPSPDGGPLPTSSEETANGFNYFLEHIWGAVHPTEFQELQELERRHKEIRTRILTEYKAHKQTSERVGQNGEAARPEGSDKPSDRGGQAVGKGAHSDAGILISENGKLKTSSSSADREKSEQTTMTKKLPKERVNTPSPSEIRLLADALRPYCRPEEAKLIELFRACRRNAPDCTVEEMFDAIHEKGEAIRTARQPLALAVTAVSRCFEGETYRRARARRAAASQPVATETPEQQIARLEEQLRNFEHHEQRAEWQAALDVLLKQQRRAARAGGAS